ncbi:MAG: ATP-binding protein [Acetanaerobacterium sp.]
MGYSNEIYAAAKAVMTERRQAARFIAKQRRAQLYADIPELETIERELILTGVAVSKAMLAPDADTGSLLESLKAKTDALEHARSEILCSCSVAEDYLAIPYHCTLCGDSGYTGGVMCACLKQELKREAFRRLNEQSPLTLSSLDQFRLDYYPESPDPASNVVPRVKMTEIFNYCTKYANTFTPGSQSILMMGPTGLGKTHLSLAIASRVIEKGYGVVYGSAQNLLHAIEQAHFSRSSTQYDALDSTLECDLLIIDDLGAEFVTSFSVSAVYNIVNTRLLTKRPTIISTNMSIAEISKAYSEKVLSRLHGSYSFLRFFGGDIRSLIKKSR